MRSTHQIFCRMPISWDFPGVFSHDYTGVVRSWEEDRRIKVPSHLIISRAPPTNMTCHCWCGSWSAGMLHFKSCLFKQSLDPRSDSKGRQVSSPVQSTQDRLPLCQLQEGLAQSASPGLHVSLTPELGLHAVPELPALFALGSQQGVGNFPGLVTAPGAQRKI